MQATTLGGSRDREALAQRPVARVDAELPPALGIDEPELAHVGELLLARVANLDGQDGVTSREAKQRVAPVDRTAEVRDDDDQGALPREPIGELERAAQRAAACGWQLA